MGSICLKNRNLPNRSRRPSPTGTADIQVKLRNIELVFVVSLVVEESVGVQETCVGAVEQLDAAADVELMLVRSTSRSMFEVESD